MLCSRLPYFCVAFAVEGLFCPTGALTAHVAVLRLLFLLPSVSICRLVIHQRSCRPDNPAKPVGAPGLGGAGAPNHPIRAPPSAPLSETWATGSIPAKLASTVNYLCRFM